MESRGLLRGGTLLLVLSLVRIAFSAAGGEVAITTEGGDALPAMLQEATEAGAEQARRSAPLGAGERVDPNRAGEEELDRLPGVGPAAARAIIDFRTESGGFAQAEDLLRVSGIGASTLARMGPHLEFTSGIPVELRHSPGSLRDRNGSTVVRSRSERVDLNLAGNEELQSLPGIGPALAQRILESRSRVGPFKDVSDLQRVAGIGPVLVDRLRQLVRAGR